jgi:hypothetical protein
MMAGSCMARTSELFDLGLWDYPLIDPETARAGGLYLPIGPWPKGTFCARISQGTFGLLS